MPIILVHMTIMAIIRIIITIFMAINTIIIMVEPLLLQVVVLAQEWAVEVLRPHRCINKI